MNLSDLLIVFSICAGLYGVGSHVWKTQITPRRSNAGGEGSKRRRLGYKKRSAGSGVQNDTNAGSERQDAQPPVVNVQTVQVTPAAQSTETAVQSTAPDTFALTARELAQLADAIHRRAEGSTVEAAVCGSFGVTKGASAGYVRAKAIFDAAMVVPGAAPEGTYTAPAPRVPARRRKVK